MKNKDKGKQKGLITLESDISKICTNDNLTKTGFLIPETERGAWMSLISDSWKKSCLPINDDGQAYLSLLLERYVKDTQIIDTFIGLEYYIKQLSLEKIEPRSLQRLGDICLFYVSLFPGRLMYRHYPTSIALTIELGETIFNSLYKEERTDNWEKRAYEQLFKHFVQYVIVLKWVNKNLPAQSMCLNVGSNKGLKFPRRHEAFVVTQQSKMFRQLYLESRFM